MGRKKAVMVVFLLIMHSFFILHVSLVEAQAGCCFTEENFCIDVESEQQCCPDGNCDASEFEAVACSQTQCAIPGCCLETCTGNTLHSQCPPAGVVPWDVQCQSDAALQQCAVGCCVYTLGDDSQVCDYDQTGNGEGKLGRDCIAVPPTSTATEFHPDVIGGACEALCVDAVPTPETTTGVLQGFVFERGGDVPIENAFVFWKEANTSTILDGSYTLQDISPGVIEFTVSKEGFVAESTFITMRKGAVISRNFTLRRHSVICLKGEGNCDAPPPEREDTPDDVPGGGGGRSEDDSRGEGLESIEIGVREPQPATSGYIVEFEGIPLILKEKELEEEAAENQAYIDQTAFYNLKRLVTKLFLVTPEKVEKELENHDEDLKKLHSNVEEKIEERLGKELEALSTYMIALNGALLNISAEEAEKLVELEDVIAVHPNVEVRTQLMDAAPLVGAEQLHDLGYTGKNITISIIDTGVDYTHPDLGGCFGEECKVIGGFDFVNRDGDPMDDNGHGTHVAGIAAGNGVLKGIAPDARLYAFKVLDRNGTGEADGILSAIERSVNLDHNTRFKKADIVSMSLGGSGTPDDAMSRAVDNVVEAGVVAVIAAGNDGPRERTVASPAAARNAITVGATYKKNYEGRYFRGDVDPRVDQITSFSSRGPVLWWDNLTLLSLVKPDVVAPGAIICAARFDSIFPIGSHPFYFPCVDEEHVQIAGTSMATPIVSGAVALMLEKNPGWSPAEIKAALRNTAVDISEGPSTQGQGRIDVIAAIDAQQAPIARLDAMQFFAPRFFNITGTATADKVFRLKDSANEFDEYRLLYGVGENPSNYTEFFSSKTPVKNGVLFSDFNSRAVREGPLIIKLIVSNQNNITSEDALHIEVNNLVITAPQNNDIFRIGDTIQVEGSVRFDGYRHVISWRESGKGNQWKHDGVRMNREEPLLGAWDTTGFEEGLYDLRVVVITANSRVEEIVREIYLDGSLKEGWPQRIDYYFEPLGTKQTGLGSVVSDLQEENERRVGNSNDTVTVSECSDVGLSDGPGTHYAVGNLEPVVADIDNDGDKEIVVFRAGLPEVLVYHHNGSLWWSERIGKGTVAGRNIHIPLVGDLDNDGFAEIIAYNHMIETSNVRGLLSAYNHDGSLLWSQWVPHDLHATFLMADLDRDGSNEIVMKSNQGIREGVVIVINSSGERISTWPVNRSEFVTDTVPSPAAGNFDDDPDLEIVIASLTRKERRELAVYNMDGSLVEGWPIQTEGESFSSPVVGDINNDGEDEIVFGLSRGVDPHGRGIYAFRRNGSVLEGWPAERERRFVSTPALADIDNDGQLEIAVSSVDNRTFVFRSDGRIMSGWPQTTVWGDSYSSIIGDINNDGVLEIITSTDGLLGSGRVYAWDAEGGLLPGFPKKKEFGTRSPPVIADIDNDGKLEVIASSNRDCDTFREVSKNRGTLYVWELNGDEVEENMPWPMFMHDTQHTGLFTEPPSATRYDMPAHHSTNLTGTRWDGARVRTTWHDTRQTVSCPASQCVYGESCVDVGIVSDRRWACGVDIHERPAFFFCSWQNLKQTVNVQDKEYCCTDVDGVRQFTADLNDCGGKGQIILK